MRNARHKWQEFIDVIDASADAQLAIAAAAVLPTFILVLGTLVTSRDDGMGPFASLAETDLARIYVVFAGLAALFYWMLGTLAAAIYRRDRRRLRGE